MRKTLLLLGLILLGQISAEAQIQVPVVYDLGVKGGERIPGFLAGGSICEEEGIRVTSPDGSGTVLLEYVQLDQIASLSLKDDTLQMKVTMKNGENFDGTIKVSASDPILILRDEIASGATSEPGKERSFKKENFKGIPLIEFEAAIPMEDCLESLKDLTTQFQAAIEAKDVEKAVDLHNQIGEVLENLEATKNSEEASSTEKAPEKKTK